MKWQLHIPTALLIAAAGVLSAADVTLGNRMLSVPEGFTLELAAQPPLTQFPIFADFDARGRLWVGEASGVKDWHKPQPADQKQNWHRLVRLTDTDGDGRFDERKVVAQFDLPVQGVQCLNGTIFVASPPCIWKLTDADDDGVPEKQEKWYEQPAPLTVCLNDLHGPFLGPDGWLYWTKGMNAEVTYGMTGALQKTRARHIFRRHPEGVLIEQVMIGGMDNPVEVTFTRGGERLLSATNFQLMGQPRRDGILHALMGAIVPKDNTDVFEFPWSTPRLYDQPVFVSGALAVAGITRCESGPWPENIVVAQFSGRRVTRLAMQPKGATFETTPEDVLTTEDTSFHPSDVIEDADGSLLVVDTGGWYLHCCPSATFFRPDAQGHIYRLRRKDAPKVADPRGLDLVWDKATPADLATRLGDSRHAVRKRALHQLATHGTAALDVLTFAGDRSHARENAVWVATQIAGDEARTFVRAALADADANVRLAALNSISLHRDAASTPDLIRILDSDASHIARRLAAEVLGRCKVKAAVPALLAVFAKGETDAALDHALGLALIEIGDAATLRAALSAAHPKARRAALMALEQMPEGRLTAAEVTTHLASADALVREAAWWVVSRHTSDWGAALAETLRTRLSDPALDPALRRDFAAKLGLVARAPELQSWMTTELKKAETPEATRILLLRAMAARTGITGIPDWVEACVALITSRDSSAELLREAAACLAAMPERQPAASSPAMKPRIETWNRQLHNAAADSRLPDDARLSLLRALHSAVGTLDDGLFDFLLARATADQPLTVRGAAADAIARSQPTAPQQARLATALKNFAASEITTVIESFKAGGDETLGDALIRSLTAAPAAASLNAYRVKNLLAAFSAAVQHRAQPLLDKLAAADKEQMARAERVLPMITTASTERGHALFQSSKTACLVCHIAVHTGGNIGPSLTALGQRRSERDILESILFPSASFVQSYESWTATLKDGGIFSGTLLADQPDEIELGLGAAKQRIPRASIASLVKGTVSIMPAGLDRSMNDQELADLVAYLKSLK